MTRYNKKEFELLLEERFPNLSRQEAMKKMKETYSVTIGNRQKSKKKSYYVRSTF